ncbi:MAG: hypothetical protein KBE97_06390 [Leptotrichiaceae bacterium]|nr:hypothetical protein [Leptotrichiaceae bacterium]
MDFNIYNKEECFNYSVIADQIIGTLYKVRKKISLTNVDYKHIEKGKQTLSLIIDGNLLESGQKDLSSLSTNNLFIYDYGSTAMRTLKELNKNEEVIEYLKDLTKVLDDLLSASIEKIKSLESFFNTIGGLLDKDIVESKYMSHLSTKNIFSVK